MSHPDTDRRITMACPLGHRVRGGADLVGRTVRCPKCRSAFVFAPERPTVATEVESSRVTDTGVMRILGDPSQLPDSQQQVDVKFRPCTRCGVAIAENVTVCSHCNCYVGVMPSFMKQLAGNIPQRT